MLLFILHDGLFSSFGRSEAALHLWIASKIFTRVHRVLCCLTTLERKCCQLLTIYAEHLPKCIRIPKRLHISVEFLVSSVMVGLVAGVWSLLHCLSQEKRPIPEQYTKNENLLLLHTSLHISKLPYACNINLILVFCMNPFSFIFQSFYVFKSSFIICIAYTSTPRVCTHF